MTRAWAIRAAAALAVIGVMVTAASADEGDAHLSARLSGFAETPPILTAGSGSFRATPATSSASSNSQEAAGNREVRNWLNCFLVTGAIVASSRAIFSSRRWLVRTRK